LMEWLKQDRVNMWLVDIALSMPIYVFLHVLSLLYL
jgi:hypothetical protein